MATGITLWLLMTAIGIGSALLWVHLDRRESGRPPRREGPLSSLT